MGDLVKTPLSEVMATLEVLDRLGVMPEDFEFLRKTSSWKQSLVARLYKNEPFVWALLEMEQAAKKVGFTGDDFLMLARSEDKLRGILALIRDVTSAPITEHLIDCDVDPFCPDGWKIEEHKKGGQIKWNPMMVTLFLSRDQKGGKRSEGNNLREVLESMSVLNANVLDYLFGHSDLIPEEWKGKYVFFWGTIYRNSDGRLYVRCLDWDGGRGRWSYGWLGDGFGSDDPAALLVK